jgi:ribosomal protein L37AE/L43A
MPEEIKQLKFKCPKCGKENLECVMDGLHACPVIEIDEDGDFEYGDYESYGDVERWQCLDCGFNLVRDDGFGEYTITDNEDVIEWIRENCPQE